MEGDETYQDAEEKNDENTSGLSRKRRIYKKAPDAPKRFKSAYICYVGDNMEAVKRQLPYDVKVTDVMKQLAVQWKNLPAEERERYERIAEADKYRYFYQMEHYTGPMRVPNKRQKKPQGAPKRAMSAFLSFSQMMRPAVRTQQPHLKNTEISGVLAERWKNASEEEKRPHIEKEVVEREKYHTDMVRWKEEEVLRNETAHVPQLPLQSSTYIGQASDADASLYASFLALESCEDMDADLAGLIYDTGQSPAPCSSSGRSESSRSASTRHSCSSRSNVEMPESELSIGPGMYGVAPSQQIQQQAQQQSMAMVRPSYNSSQSSYSSRSYGAGSNSSSSARMQGSAGRPAYAQQPDMTPLQIFGSQRAQDPVVGTYLHLPHSSSNIGMPAPTTGSSRPRPSVSHPSFDYTPQQMSQQSQQQSMRSASGPRTILYPQQQQQQHNIPRVRSQPSMLSTPYWSDDSAQQQQSSSDRLMDQAFGSEAPLLGFGNAPSASRSHNAPNYSSTRSISGTLAAVYRSSMYDQLDSQASQSAGASWLQPTAPRPALPQQSATAAAAADVMGGVRSVFQDDMNYSKTRIPLGQQQQHQQPQQHQQQPYIYQQQPQQQPPQDPVSSQHAKEQERYARQKQQMHELLARQRHEQQEQESRQAKERLLLLEAEDMENCRVFLSSPSDEGGTGSPLEK